MLVLMSVDLYFTLALLFYPLLNNSSSDDAGPLSVTHLHIREIGHPYVILKRFPCGKKNPDLYYISPGDCISTCWAGHTVAQDYSNFPISRCRGISIEFVTQKKSTQIYCFFFSTRLMEEEKGEFANRPAKESGVKRYCRARGLYLNNTC